MKKISLGISCCMLVAMVVFNSCSKDGPAGATGPAGPAGPGGAAGPAGPAGPAGTANFIYCDWLDVTYLPDTIHTGTVIDTLGFYSDLTVTKMTADMLSKGELKVYWNQNTLAAPNVVPLPYFDGNFIISANFFLQGIELYSNANLSTRTINNAKVFQYRYILIPGGVPARSAVDWENYADVQKYLGLKD